MACQQSTKGNLYETDTYAWVNAQADALRGGQISQADITNLAEEIAGIARTLRIAMVTAVRNALIRMALLRYAPAGPRPHWEFELASFRSQIDDLVDDSPSLRALLDQSLINQEWSKAARILGPRIGGLPACPFSLEQVLDPDYVPANVTV